VDRNGCRTQNRTSRDPWEWNTKEVNKESRLMLIACLCGRRHFLFTVTPAVDVLFRQDLPAPPARWDEDELIPVKSALSQLAIGSQRITRISQAERRSVRDMTRDDKCC